MTRHQPTPAEQAAIDLLAAAGYAVVRRKTLENLHQKVRDAEWQVRMATEEAASARRWAENSLTEERRLHDRLNEIVAFAYEHGATIEGLVRFNDRLATATPSTTATMVTSR